MSQIASFYTIDKNLSEALLQAAVPEQKIIEKKLLFFTRKITTTVDNYWDFIKQQTTPQEDYPYSGTGFTDLELLLEEKGISLYKFDSSDFARRLSAARPSIVAVFDHMAAINTIKMLDGITKEEARKYSQENFPKEDDAEFIMSAYDIFRRWLGSVAEAQIGLLMIG